MEDKSDKIIGLIGKLWAEMRASVGSLQTDIGAIRSDIGSLRSDVNALNVRTGRLENTLDRVLVRTVTIEEIVRDHTPRLVRLENNWQAIGEDIHEFTGRIKTHDIELAAHSSAHRKYEHRLDRLERVG